MSIIAFTTSVQLNCPDYRGSAGEDTMRVVVLLGLSAILLNACATPSSVTRNDTSDALLTLDVPIKTAYRLAVEAATEGRFAVVSEQPDKNEIKLRSGSYMTGAFLCSGHILGVFLTDLEGSRTKVSVVERLILGTQVLGCHDKAPEYAARLHNKSLQATAAHRPPPKLTETSTSGTGFVVSRAGHVLTNDHVARGCKELIAHSSHASFSAVLIRSDSANDLALLMSSFVPSKIASFRSGKGIRPGDDVIAFGFPLAGALASEGNVTTGNVSALAGLRDDTRYLQITTPVQPGNSGGPLLDDSGLVVGVVASKLDAIKVAGIVGDIPQNVNFAIKDVIARSFLEASGVLYESSQSARPITAAEVGATAKEFTVRVECRR